MTTLTTEQAAAGPAVPAVYEAVVRAKEKRDRASYDAFRAVDQRLYEQARRARVEAAVRLAAEDLECWREDEAGVKADAAGALAAARVAEDKAVEAAEFAAQAQQVYLKVKDSGSPEQVTAAMRDAQNAVQVAEDRGRAAEAAGKASENADYLLATSRDELAKAEARLAQAKRAAEAPAGPARPSDATIAACFVWMQRDEVWETLSKVDQRRVTAAAREVRTVPVTVEEFRVFEALMDASMTAGARREAARLDNGSIGTPLLRPVRVV